MKLTPLALLCGLVACSSTPGSSLGGNDANPASDAALDAGPHDTGANDAAPADVPQADAATSDAGGADSGMTDSGIAADAGTRDASAGQDASSADVGCPTPVALSEVQLAVFDGCSGRGPMTCHTRAPFLGDLDLTNGNSYRALVGVTSSRSADLRVVAGDPSRSFLWRKLINALAANLAEGDPMPKGEAIAWRALPDDQLNLVRCWIAQGAPP